jgi:CBS-domain-containing membrane protein
MAVKFVRDLMHIGVSTCRTNTSVAEAARTLLRENLEALIVLDDNGHAVGLLGRREVVAACAQAGTRSRSSETATAGDVMRLDIPEIPADIPAIVAAQIMLDQGVREIYLMHHAGGISWPAAVLRFEDVLRYLAAESEADLASMGAGAPRKSPVETFMERYSKTKTQPEEK